MNWCFQRRWCAVVPVLAVLSVACGADSKRDDSGAAKKPDDGVLFDPDGGSLFGSPNDARCITQRNEAEALPLDLYVLFDQSGSMATPADDGSRLDAIRAAFTDFVRAPDTAGMGVGLGYFGTQPIGQVSCDPADYAKPAVPIGLLPEQASALVGSLNGIVPTGETPTAAALRGACSYTASWKESHPGRTIDLLLLTDGVPEAPVSRTKPGGCDPKLDDAVAAARACVSDAVKAIYVLGVGPNLANLNQIAEAGGSDSAFLVDGSDVSGKVLSALDAIRGTALPCSFHIPSAPEGQTLDRDRVNVVVTDTTGKERVLDNVPDAASCGAAGGWYYAEDDQGQERIELCEGSCQFAKSQSKGGAIEFALGCQTQSVTR